MRVLPTGGDGSVGRDLATRLVRSPVSALLLQPALVAEDGGQRGDFVHVRDITADSSLARRELSWSSSVGFGESGAELSRD